MLNARLCAAWLSVGGDILNHAAIAVFTHDSLAWLAGKPLIEALLNAFNSLTVDVGKTDEVSGLLLLTGSSGVILHANESPAV
nr:Uncharacterised protein [Salmonella sp. NCTC 7297]